MSLTDEKVIGQKILERIDRLVEVVIAAKLKNPQVAEQAFLESCQIVEELFGLLAQIIGRQNDYLTTAVKELVTQRIPDQRLLNGIDLQSVLEEICQRVRENSAAAWQDGDYPEEAVPYIIRDQVERALGMLYPHQTILRKHRHNGIYFEYFLPSQKIAVDENSSSKDEENTLREFICRKDGIKFVAVDKSVAGYREIARQIKRQLAV